MNVCRKRLYYLIFFILLVNQSPVSVLASTDNGKVSTPTSEKPTTATSKAKPATSEAVKTQLDSTKAETKNTSEIKTSVTKSDSKKSMVKVGEAVPSGNLLQLFSGLFVVIAAIVVMVWVMKKFGRYNFTGAQSIKIVAGMSIGAREKLLVVEVGNEQLLIGVSPGRINKLHVLSNKIEVPDTGESFQSILGDKVKGFFRKDKSS